jgi:hypothetical protein
VHPGVADIAIVEIPIRCADNLDGESDAVPIINVPAPYEEIAFHFLTADRANIA